MQASTYSWTGGTTGIWATPGNWTRYANPSATLYPVAGDTAVFNGINNQNETIYLNAAQAAATVDFNNTGTTILLGSNADTSANYALTLTAGINIFAGAGAVTIGDTTAGTGPNGVNLTLSGTQTLSNNSSNALTIANALNVGTTSATTLTLAGSGDLTTNYGIITASSGAVSLTKTGSGTLTETGSNANTYTGATAFTGGTVNLDYSQGMSRLSSTSTLTLVGVTLNLSGAAATAYTQAVSATTIAAGASTGGRTNSGNATLTLGAITRSSFGTLNVTTAGVTTSSTGSNGILGGYAVYGTTGSADWAVGNGASTSIGGYGSYTALPTTGGTATANYLQTDSATLTASQNAYTVKLTDTTTGGTLNLGANTLTFGTTSSAATTGGLLYTGANGYAVTNGTLKPAGSEFIVQ